MFLEQVMTRINKRTKKSLDIFQEMSKLQNEIVSDMGTMYAADDPTHTTVLLMKEAANELEISRQKMADRVEKNSIRPMEDYCNQFKEVKRRMDEYTHRRTEMERQKIEVAKLQEKGPTAKPKLTVAEDKYRLTLQGYEELREELMRDLPALNDDRGTVLGYVLACSLKSRAEFYSGLAEKYNVISHLVSSIDESSILHHQHVITPQETSAAATNLRDHPVFNKGEKAQVASPTQTPITSSPPPSQHQPISLQKQTTPSTTTTFTTTAPAPSAPNQDYFSSSVNPYDNKTSGSAPVYISTPVITQPQQLQPEQQQPQQQQQQSEDPAILIEPIIVQGMYDFNASEENELSFTKGDVIKIVAKHGDWWEGEFDGRIGLLPSNYVKEM